MNRTVAIFGAVAVLLMLFMLTLQSEHMGGQKARNESVAVAYLKRIAAAETRYRLTHRGSYSSSLKDLEGLSLSDLEGLDGDTPTYVFKYIPDGPDADHVVITYSATAEPRVPQETGDRYFYIDQSTLLHYEFMKPATPASPHL